VIWEDGQPRLLEGWQGRYNGFADMNDAGQIVGSRYTPERGYFGFLYQDGELIDLGLSEWVTSNPVAINGEGDVIGSAQDSDWNSLWFLMSEGSIIPLEDLLPSDLGWTILELLDLNDSGQILGAGYDDQGRRSSFLLTPPGMDAPAAVSAVDQVVPEPTTLAMLGLIGALGLARRASRAARGRR
jgi:probable HAF family extracellular repeat protein